ncbi:hypothetical protein PSE_0719 [Pseudovibrio sp. FO-BEG1]|nr:hypothetical protein PSE_0719 [Pseudovibrio sp. FO-BEG1]
MLITFMFLLVLCGSGRLKMGLAHSVLAGATVYAFRDFQQMAG